MKCRTVREYISSSLDGRIRKTELKELRHHLARCPGCALHFHQTQKLRTTMQTLPARRPPKELATNLRVIASQQQIVRQRHSSITSSVRYWRGNVQLWLSNLMRPVALPFAGGLVSAFFLFSMMAPMYSNNVYYENDVPTMLTTTAGLKSSPVSFGISKRDIVVDVFIDGEGRLLDYAVPDGQVWQFDPNLKRCIENTLLCTQFEPATMFGLPKSGKIRITLRRNEVDVQG